MKTAFRTTLALLLVALLSGCGNTYMGRMTTGAAIGTVAGAAGAVILESNPFTGALLGAGAGMLIGATTSRGDDPDFY